MNRSEAEIRHCRLKRLRPLMGTFVAIEATHISAAHAAAALEAAFRAIAELEGSLHPERPSSDLAAIRDAARGTRIEIKPSTLEVLYLAREVWEQSNRVFDPCLPDVPGSMADLTIGDTYVSARKPVHIDLGGIAKGYAVDVAIETLIACGCDDGIVNAGGDMRAFGAPTEIIVRCGEEERRRTLSNSAIAVSDAIASASPSEHRGYYRRGAATHLFARGVVVSASRAAVADALTKCLLLSERDAATVLRYFNATAEMW